MKLNPLLFTVLAAAWLIGCSRAENTGNTDGIRRVERDRAKLSELASERNAVVDWTLSLPERGNGKLFSMDLTKVLVRTNGQSVGVIAQLTDLSEGGGVFIAHFDMLPFLPANGQSYFHLPLRFFLTCTDQQTESLRNSRPESGAFGMRFAVIAKIESVSRPTDAAIHVEDESTLDAKGVCVDFLRLESWTKK